MAVFSYIPEWGVELEVEPRVRVAKFGDGYEQRIADGVNAKPRSWSVQFAARDETEADAIIAFLEARGGVESFTWTDPDGVSAQWVCRKWKRVRTAHNFNTISATFEQVFE